MPRKTEMGRPKSPKNRGLPPNLHFDISHGLYRYRHPVKKKTTYLSNNRADCIKAAHRLNAMFIPASADLITKVIGGGQTFAAALNKYMEDVYPELQLAEKTDRQYRTYLAKCRACSLGPMAIADITVKDIVTALGELTTGKRMRNVYRHQLIQVFRYSVELGWREDNPVEVTRIVSDKRERMRLSIEGFDAIHAKAEPWLQIAMDLALQTLQPRQVLSVMRYSDIDAENRLRMIREKTGVKLRIEIGPELAEIIARSRTLEFKKTRGRATVIASPFIVHRPPNRMRPSDKRSTQRQHHTQVLPEQLTEAFRNARRASGYYAGEKKPPTLHEIRSLGADRYRDQGWPEEWIQALLGHEDAETTRLYLEGHEPPWQDAKCGLTRKKR